MASSSQTMHARACSCSADTVHMWLTPFSMHSYSARALDAPEIITSTSLASMIVPTPTVSAILGTAARSLPKKRELAMIVS